MVEVETEERLHLASHILVAAFQLYTFVNRDLKDLFGRPVLDYWRNTRFFLLSIIALVIDVCFLVFGFDSDLKAFLASHTVLVKYGSDVFVLQIAECAHPKHGLDSRGFLFEKRS